VRDPYEALGVSPDASAQDIKKAYRRLAKRFHPDSTGGDKAKETRFKEVSTAYDIVGDPEKRARYDAMRRQGAFSAADMGDGGGGVDLGDILAQMFGGAGGPAGAAARGGGPGGVKYRVYSTPTGGFRESFFGGGDGFGGESPFDFHEPSAPRRRSRAAPHQVVERKVRASDGSLVTQRDSDVHSDVRLSYDEAVLGTVAEVPTLSGRASVKIPPGTSSGVKLRLKGKGADDGHGHRGDHFVTVHIDVPKQIDEEAKRLLVAFIARAGKRRGGDKT
jgi:DnaJ-class molecular chaperone